jgi:nitrate reductase NapD
MRDVDRRKFLNGGWPARADMQTSKPFEVASLLVQVRPERIDSVACAIERLSGSHVYSRSPQGKLVVVVEADTVGYIGATLNAISCIPHVLSAALVFHGADER